MNWMVDEILEELRSMARMYTSGRTRCCNEKRNFKDVYSTDDKFEATKNEYWRSREIMCTEVIKDLHELITMITDMMEEDIKETEEAEENERDLRGEWH